MRKCDWWACDADAWYVLIQGCFQQHMKDSVICLEHFKTWLREYLARNVDCQQCGDTVEEYITSYISITGAIQPVKASGGWE
jgi:hypothetical protein